MHKRLRLMLLALSGVLAFAHPMGNFSVSHYARFEALPGLVEIVYALDLAELPTFDLLRQWGLERNSPQAELDRKATVQAGEWIRNLSLTANGRPVAPQLERVQAVIADGAGNLPVLRITSHLRVRPASGKLTYEDRNYPDRAGWKEIVIRPGSGAKLVTASQTAVDRSQALTAYPQDPTVAPPQDVRASFEWSGEAPVVVTQETSPPVAAPPVIAPLQQPKAPPALPPAATTPAGAPAGTVVKGDYLSRFLHQRELSLSMILIALGVAFVLGAAHALTPGHGKTIVAAYLVGSRGTLKHAAFLGAMVTFTHTVSVFLLGLATLFLFQYVMPEKITQALGVVSGLSIVGIGAYMLYQRWRAVGHGHSHAHGHTHSHDHAHEHAVSHSHSHEGGHARSHNHGHDHSHDHDHALKHSHSHEVGHEHSHDHDHAVAHSHSHEVGHTHSHDHDHAVAHSHSHEVGHTHSHDHDHAVAHRHSHEVGHTHSHDHGHTHSHGPLVHSHGPGGHVHSHDVPDAITWGSLTALAVSGGLVPCESALVLLLSAIALGRVGLGLLLLIAFSLGLAIVLMAIGVLVIYAKNLFPKSDGKPRHPAFRWIPVVSAAVVMVIGMIMTGVSLGWIQAKWAV